MFLSFLLRSVKFYFFLTGRDTNESQSMYSLVHSATTHWRPPEPIQMIITNNSLLFKYFKKHEFSWK